MLNNKIIKEKFPVGFYNDLHQDFSINFQMNRFYNWSNDEEMLKEMKEVSPYIHNYEDYINKFLELSEKALKEGKKLRAAYYLRGAEFYISETDPKKQACRKHFISLMQEHFHVKDSQHYKVPYENGFLSAYRFTPEAPKGTFVMFGGFDSYIEEIFSVAMIIKDEGYSVICFDGPGQGTTLEDYKISMTHEWEKPVKAILDFFKTDDATLFGLSLGGYLAIRAAAFENRVKCVIADDICADFYQILLRQIPVNLREEFQAFMLNQNDQEVNSLIKKLMKESLMLEWAVNQGMHITGTQTPYDFMSKMMLFNTKEISAKVEQDVLLMAAQEDHYIPLNQLFEQSKSLINVRSLTTRMFTRKENAQNHCHVGNIGLSIEVILNWLEQNSKQKTLLINNL
ncbi:alpha/beta hydrolase family protein [Clostridium saccharoperbutylacetonicum]|uniref:alpha/beta hydrolase family protein n=1 Tax=Clostridium saccharoperbutylacetonicum TaxID=36745 RepID=UPI000983E533|nr:alpha/beta hydrolase [Clostridium saccharoperbutylacetonicum]AQR94698.1 2,6-dihydropseudooxynicotine hydrolase [Clostridium saccharoperbutylacetonicum]NSB30539.1 pimeloyl-ACP methyl ester carboxylesterase [Clostridium saccharoperbutylacetonicum]